MDTQLRELNLRLVGIARVLQDRLLRVPRYQRSYSWGKEQVDVFWRDLQAAMLSGAPDYFMGTIVLSNEVPPGESRANSRITVIDGQQRLATVSILLACMRDALKDAGESGRAATITADFLSTRDIRSDESVPRFQLNSEDADFFVAHIVDDEAPPSSFEHLSNRRLFEARELLSQLLTAEIRAAGSNWLSRLIDWIDFLQSRVRVISIQVETEADAFLIFETLNDRGLSLTIADLLKNHLLSTANAGTQAEQVHSAWMTMLTAFPADREYDDNDLVTTFIRHYWSSLHGATRERELYQSLKKRVRGAEQAAELVQNLSLSAPSYAALLDADHYLWQETGISRELSDSVLRFGLEQPRPMLLAAMDLFDSHELGRLLEACVSWLTRGLIVGGIGGGQSERYYSSAAEAVRKGRARTMESVAKILDPIIPSDSVFEAAFETKRVNSPRLAKYYLAALERHEEGASIPALIADSDLQKQSLSFVMPRRPDAELWPGFPSENIGQWTLRLGNQVLLEADAVSTRFPNYERRRSELAESRHLFAQEIAKGNSTWGANDVGDRQSRLAKSATQVWKRFI